MIYHYIINTITLKLKYNNLIWNFNNYIVTFTPITKTTIIYIRFSYYSHMTYFLRTKITEWLNLGNYVTATKPQNTHNPYTHIVAYWRRKTNNVMYQVPNNTLIHRHPINGILVLPMRTLVSGKNGKSSNSPKKRSFIKYKNYFI
jgi:hypothetical protein